MGYLVPKLQRWWRKQQRMEKQLSETENRETKKKLEKGLEELNYKIKQDEINKNKSPLENFTLVELKKIASDKGLKGYSSLRKEEIIKLLEEESNNE